MIKLSLIFCFIILSLCVLAHNETDNKVDVNHDSIVCASGEIKTVVGEIRLIGNKKTVDRIIFRELVFKKGDTISRKLFQELLVQSRQNLLNRSLFNFVDVGCSVNKENPELTDILIYVTERWYVWPLPIFELADRNFNIWWKTKDFSKVNYGIYSTHNNFRGRNEKLKLLIRSGYNQNYFLMYEVPYITKKQNLGIGIQIGESQSREIPYATEYDKHVFFKDENDYALKEIYAKVLISYRLGIHDFHSFSITYENYHFADTILIMNPGFVDGNMAISEMLAFAYLFKHDYRDNKAYPLDGHYFDTEITKRGLGIFETSPDFFTVKSTFDFYKPIWKRLYWASSIATKFSGGTDQPYFLTRGLGYGNDYVRGNELYVVDGQNFGLLKNNLKLEVLKPKIGTIPWIKTEKFNKIHYALYLNWLFDIGYVHNEHENPTTRIQNKLLYGTGLGLDLVTYYDLVFRVEYSVNQFGKTGLYLQFVAPI
jgi:outer membrane protein assembly factor BamA